MTTPTEQQLQLALAKELPELIEYNNHHETFVWSNPPGWEPVTPREWEWIVRECEKKLTEEQKHDFVQVLCKLNEEKPGEQCALLEPWPTRAAAYFKTINKTIV